MEHMENEKNIQLTLVRPPEDRSDELTIDLFGILRWMRRLLSLWLALSIALGALAVGILGWRHTVSKTSNAVALLGYTHSGASEGKAPDGGKLDVTMVKSPVVVEDALNTTGLSQEMMDKVRTSISLDRVVSEKTQDRRILFNTLLEKSGINIEVVNQLLATSDNATQYIISFDFRAAGLSEELGTRFLNALLEAYRAYFEEIYNSNVTLGNTLAVINYQDYDYAEAAMIFEDALKSVKSYIKTLQASDKISFRSSETGYTFSDLMQLANTLGDVELYQASSYIAINRVSENSAEREIAHYEWLIEELVRERSVEQGHLASLTESLAAYDKAPIVATTETMDDYTSRDTVYYDNLVHQKLASQETISGYSNRIRYYERVIEGFRSGPSVTSQASIKRAKAYLEVLNEKMELLQQAVQTSADEFYRSASTRNTVRILVPAIVDSESESNALSGALMKPLLILEVLVFLCYCGAAFFLSIKESNTAKTEKNADKTPESALQPEESKKSDTK